MTPSELGPWILLGLGVVCIFAAIISGFKEVSPRVILMIWIFGVALLGVGSYGPIFLSSYTKFIRAMMAWEKSPTDENLAQLLESASSDKLPEGSLRAVTRYALSTGGESSLEVLDRTINTLPEGNASRKVLVESRDEFRGEKNLHILAKIYLEEEIGESEPETELGTAEMVAPLLRLPDDRLEALSLDRELLEQAAESTEAAPIRE